MKIRMILGASFFLAFGSGMNAVAEEQEFPIPDYTTEEYLAKQANTSESMPDSIWKPLEMMIQVVPQMRGLGFVGIGEDRLDFRRWADDGQLYLRTWGGKVCKHFQNDPRCLRWFVATAKGRPSYAIPHLMNFADGERDGFGGEDYGYPLKGPVDVEAKKEWLAVYKVWRARLVAAQSVSDEDKAAVIYGNEIFPKMVLSKQAALRKEPAGWESLRNDVYDLMSIAPESEGASRTAVKQVKSLLERYDAPSVPQYLSHLASLPNRHVRALMRAPAELSAARIRPMSISGTAIDGRELDVKDMRGKAVMVVFGAYTWCGICQARRPWVRALYDRYHAEGLEIIEMAFEQKESDRAYVLKHIQEDGIPWPHLFFSDMLNNEYARRFGMTGVPGYFVLDRDGLLVHATETGGTHDLVEVRIREVLGLDAEFEPVAVTSTRSPVTAESGSEQAQASE